MSAKFIVLEGIDGAGTTTQAERLGRHFAAHVTGEPSRGPIGLGIRQLLKSGDGDERALALLFAADRVDHGKREIEPQLARGRHVVSDRYLLSSLVYQTLFVDREFVTTINRFARSPDLTVFVRVPVSIAEERRAARGAPVDRYEYRALQERVAAAYEREIERFALPLVVVDGTRDIERVFADVRTAVESCVSPAAGSSL